MKFNKIIELFTEQFLRHDYRMMNTIFVDYVIPKLKENEFKEHLKAKYKAHLKKDQCSLCGRKFLHCLENEIDFKTK